MNNFSYRFFKNHWLCHRSDMPVLLGSDGISGEWHQSSVLPGGSDTAYNIVLRALAREPLPNDPEVSVEAGADRDQWMLEWLGIRDEEVERSKLIVKIMQRVHGKK